MARLYREFIDRKKFIRQTEFIHAWRGSTERHPWRLGSRQPTRPATDRFRARQPRSEEGRAGAGRGAALARSRAWLGSTEDSSTGENSFPGRIHPRMAWIYRAPSMALAPPRNPRARPRTGSVRASHGVKKERQERVAALRLLGAEHGSALQRTHRPEISFPGRIHPRMAWIYRAEHGSALQKIHFPDEFIHAWRGSTGRAGRVSKAGRGEVAGA